jgi:anti-sigma B factor antagonist
VLELNLAMILWEQQEMMCVPAFKRWEDVSLKVILTEKDKATEVIAEGNIDLHSSPALRKSILDAANHNTKEIRVVLTSVDYMDSSGVATLVEGLHTAKKSGKTFTLHHPSQSVMKVLQLTRLDTIFTIVLDRKE